MFRAILRVGPKVASYRNASTLAALKDYGLRLKSSPNVKTIRECVLTELRPPTPIEIPKAIKDLAQLFTKRNWQNVTVREAWLNTLVTTEVICWFFVGECIGKGTLIGYQV